MTERASGDTLRPMTYSHALTPSRLASIALVAMALAAQGCDISVPIVDASPDTVIRDVTQVTDGDATVNPDAPSLDAPPVDAPRIEAGDVPAAPFDGASGIGNGTCAETGSYCNAHEQCCSGLCATATSGGGGACALTTDGGTRPTWPVRNDGGCAHPCSCRSNQHCCLNASTTVACGVTQLCSVIEGCL